MSSNDKDIGDVSRTKLSLKPNSKEIKQSIADRFVNIPTIDLSTRQFNLFGQVMRPFWILKKWKIADVAIDNFHIRATIKSRTQLIHTFRSEIRFHYLEEQYTTWALRQPPLPACLPYRVPNKIRSKLASFSKSHIASAIAYWAK